MLLLSDFYAFYEFCAVSICVSSYLIDSGDFCVGSYAGGNPAATHFLLLRQKKVSKEKATRLSGSLRFASGDLRCPKKTGVGANSLHCVALRQRAALTPFFWGIACPDRTGLRVRGGNGNGNGSKRGSWSARADTDTEEDTVRGIGADFPSCSFSLSEKVGMRASGGRMRASQQPSQSFSLTYSKAKFQFAESSSPPSPKGRRRKSKSESESISAPESAPASPVLAGPVLGEESGIKASDCLSRRRVRARPPLSSTSTGCPKRSAGTRTADRRFFAYFLLAKQKKVSCRRAPPGKQAQTEKPKALVKPMPVRRKQVTGMNT